MTHAPPIPGDQVSPFPTHEPPHAASLPPVKPEPATEGADESSQVGGEGIAAAASAKVKDAVRSAEKLVSGSDTRRMATLGAGVAIGSAAILAAALYMTRDRKDDGDRKGASRKDTGARKK